jgi:hypothetical protein
MQDLSNQALTAGGRLPLKYGPFKPYKYASGSLSLWKDAMKTHRSNASSYKRLVKLLEEYQSR